MPLETRRPIVAHDPEAGFPDLVASLADDAKHLVASEARLARIELRGSMRQAGRGALWISVALAIGVIGLVALTIALVAALAAIAGGNVWLGAIVVGLIEIGVGVWLVKSGIARFGSGDED